MLFFFMAEQHEHNWLKELQLENINLGSGNRFVVKNGTLNKRYNVTVPGEVLKILFRLSEKE
jgi:hypothetical protein